MMLKSLRFWISGCLFVKSSECLQLVLFIAGTCMDSSHQILSDISQCPPFFFFFLCESCLGHLFILLDFYRLAIAVEVPKPTLQIMLKNVIICSVDLRNTSWKCLLTYSAHHFIYLCNKYLLPLFHVPSWELGTGHMLVSKLVIWKSFKMVQFLARGSEKCTRHYCPVSEQLYFFFQTGYQ